MLPCATADNPRKYGDTGLEWGRLHVYTDPNIPAVGTTSQDQVIVLDQGKNRHIRRMLSELAIEVLRLVRVAIGPVRLGNLPKGKARPLTNEEKKALAGG